MRRRSARSRPRRVDPLQAQDTVLVRCRGSSAGRDARDRRRSSYRTAAKLQKRRLGRRGNDVADGRSPGSACWPGRRLYPIWRSSRRNFTWIVTPVLLLQRRTGHRPHHPQVIPREVLDRWKRPVLLSTEALERKLIFSGRGGWCFEHNLLLSRVLQAIGFRVTGLAARVVWNAPDDLVRARSHMYSSPDRYPGRRALHRRCRIRWTDSNRAATSRRGCRTDNTSRDTAPVRPTGRSFSVCPYT